MPSLAGAFCGVGVAINHLKIWQAPIVEQFRPFIIAMVAPDSEQWDPVIYLGILPEPPTRLAASPRLQPPQERRFAARRIPELPCDHASAMPSRILVGACAP
jgi:hypothetical protein